MNDTLINNIMKPAMYAIRCENLSQQMLETPVGILGPRVTGVTRVKNPDVVTSLDTCQMFVTMTSATLHPIKTELIGTEFGWDILNADTREYICRINVVEVE